MFLRFFGSAMAAFLDWSVGMFVVYIGSLLFDFDPSIPRYVVGGLLALAPDFDVLYALAKKGMPSDMHHEILTHRPLVILPVATLVGFGVGGAFWATIVFLCLLCHYLHDTEGLGGGGIAWFWPFSRKYFSPITGAVEPEHSLQAEWSGRADEWFSLWFRPSALSVREIGLGSLLFGVSTGGLFGWQFGVLAATMVLLGTIFVWMLYAYRAARS